jgi:methyltransferase (TIGR00027 family)
MIDNVSDTARWVAVYRARESARPDALFTDPFAERLAGARGRAIADAAPKQMKNGWPIVVRTKIIDELVMAAVRGGCDRVLNLAAGLDSRPYRLRLPQELAWIEADLPALVEEKEALFAGEKPACGLAREKVDHADDAARRAFLDRATADAKRVLVITEGLLPYLYDEVVRSLGKDLLRRPAIHSWMFDVGSPAVVAMMRKQMGDALANAPMRFAPPNGVAFFEAIGWKARDVRPIFREAFHVRRLPWFLRPFGVFPDPNPRKLGRAMWSAVVRMER